MTRLRQAKNPEPFRRLGHPVHQRVRPCSATTCPDQAEIKAAIAEGVNRLFMPILRDRDRLTVLSSANVGYGTNHLACELSGLAAYVRAFRDDADFAKMTSGGPALVDYAKAWLARFMNYMDDGGYWPRDRRPCQLLQQPHG